MSVLFSFVFNDDFQCCHITRRYERVCFYWEYIVKHTSTQQGVSGSLKTPITLDIVVPIIEFISKEKERCAQRFLPNTVLVKNDECCCVTCNAGPWGYGNERSRQALHSGSLLCDKVVLWVIYFCTPELHPSSSSITKPSTPTCSCRHALPFPIPLSPNRTRVPQAGEWQVEV